MKWCFTLITTFLLFTAVAQDRMEYIEQYRDIAIAEMQRTGIPASIKLAQAILESGAGSSTLARRANNHFGIKCGSSWGGKKMYRKDDDRNAHGRLVNSCFRSFDSAKESFVAHSEFLRDPAKEGRYGFLFELQSDDYRGWAKGLKRAGYATNSRYSQLLIQIIEQYGLHEYDAMTPDALAGSAHSNPDHSMSRRSYAVLYRNKVKYVKAREGDDLDDIAQITGVPVARLMKYNEAIGQPYYSLDRGEVVYLQSKRNKYKGGQKFHVVGRGETMIQIARAYAVKTSALYRRNDMPPSTEPAVGELLALRGHNKHVVKLRAHDADTRGPRPERSDQNGIFLDAITPGSEEDDEHAVEEASPPEPLSTEESDVTDSGVPPGYVVQPSDTLYTIARIHGLSVPDLKKINNLDGDVIQPGQVLKIAK